MSSPRAPLGPEALFAASFALCAIDALTPSSIQAAAPKTGVVAGPRYERGRRVYGRRGRRSVGKISTVVSAGQATLLVHGDDATVASLDGDVRTLAGAHWQTFASATLSHFNGEHGTAPEPTAAAHARRPEWVQLKPTVTLGIEPIEVAFTRDGNRLTGTVPPNAAPGPWVLRVEVQDQFGALLGRDFLEIGKAPPPAGKTATARVASK